MKGAPAASKMMLLFYFVKQWTMDKPYVWDCHEQQGCYEIWKRTTMKTDHDEWMNDDKEWNMIRLEVV